MQDERRGRGKDGRNEALIDIPEPSTKQPVQRDERISPESLTMVDNISLSSDESITLRHQVPAINCPEKIVST